MMLKRKNKIVLFTLFIVLILGGCGKNNNEDNSDNNDNNANNNEQASPTPSSMVKSIDDKSINNLRFPSKDYSLESKRVNNEEIRYYEFEDIVYVNNPVDKEYQEMNIYIPEAYLNNGSVGNFSADTAPIFFQNNVGGYLPSDAGEPEYDGAIEGDESRVGITDDEGSKDKTPNAILLALSKGYVVASPATRGRTLKDRDGKYTGKAPAAIVDLKAAVRYLHYNDDVMPGDANKIISNGTSAGGNLSALLGATGDNTDYEKYLKDLGAADASDTIYAVSAYCPITNLENADKAYEWTFNGIDKYEKVYLSEEDDRIVRNKENKTLTADEKKYSTQLKNDFITYINNLNLKDVKGNDIKLDENETFKRYIIEKMNASLQKEIDSGKDLSKEDWLTIDNKNITKIDFEKYVKKIGRSKGVPAFDALNLSQPENSLFGTSITDAKHFTEFSAKHDSTNDMADNYIVKLMNPIDYIGQDNTNIAQYWRIRHGLNDTDTSIAIPSILAISLEQNGQEVDFAIPYGQGHGGDYDLEELFTWIESII